MTLDRVNGALRRLPDWPLYVLGAVPVIWLYALGLTGGLGVEPVEVIEHKLGLWALWLLMAGLAITPLQRFAGLRLLKFRRAVGLLAFAYVTVHLATWLVFDIQFFGVWADIAKRPYITVGMAAFVLMIPLAATSTTWAIRRLGAARWQQLHKIVYAVALLGGLHFVMLRKGFQLEPLIYLALVCALLALRLRPRKRRRESLA